jgi:UDP-N-acetylglucosamine--N-acetylmuramyl-(pentapeptide) pyrophosphoryl-undecaprenol N-acetylglucosamine transferase
MDKFFPSSKIIVTGNPVRKIIVENESTKVEALKFFGLQENKKTVLSVGGSLGAQSINKAIAKGLNRFEENDLQLIWQTGQQFFQEATKISQGKTNVSVTDFIQHMEFAYTAADVVISRSGAMAVAELCVVKKPVVFVPYPYAAEDHQTVNAAVLAKQNAALVVADNNVNQELVDSIIQLAKDNTKQNELRNNINAFAVANADEIIAKAILFDEVK